ncbi:sorting nexin-22 isoform X3 [Gasterosteus aculeatus]|uniref:sorting nexin-22 isoform X3 n=1 Tax=Gasterosteus aculeatus aculeatus TaxID=481459 RepID=UPI001A9921DA|nr:sorting nexin-22 isoform X3 [Gasterosteus aculeatus aculeatus]
MIEVSIPSMEKEVDESGKSRKLFRVEVLFNGRKHFVLRRNSEFQTLHRKLRKIIQTPDLPSKRNPHLRTKPLQQRSQELEDYVQDIIYQNEDVPQVLLDFLHLKHFHTGNKVSSMESLDDLDSRDYRSPRCRRGRRPSGSLSPRRPGQLHRDRPRHVCVGPKSRIG